MKPLSLESVPLQGMNLIEASAGTGKTFSIVHLFLRLLIEPQSTTGEPLKLNQILVVTYTVLATQELKTRIRKGLGQFKQDFILKNPHSKNPLVPFYLKKFEEDSLYQACILRLFEAEKMLEELQVFTIHSFCQRMLQENAIFSGLLVDTEVLSNRTLLREVIDDFWRKKFYLAPLRLAEQLRNETFIKGKNLTRSTMFNFCGQYLEFPNLKIISSSQAPSSDEVQEYINGLRDLGQMWKSHRQQILDRLLTPDLNQKKYKPELIQKWSLKMDGLFQEWTYPLPVPECFERFTKSCLKQSVNKGRTVPTHPFFDQAESFWQRYQYTLASWNAWYIELMKELLRYCQEELQHRKQEANVVFFHDLLQQLHRTLESPAGGRICRAIQARYGAALIDEFQDTDAIQWKIFKKLFLTPSHTLFLIGDPKQAIYRFRGADLRTYLQAREDVNASQSGGSCYTLKENYRSEFDLLSAFNCLFNKKNIPLQQAPFLEQEIVFEELIARKQGNTLQIEGTSLSPKPFQIWMVNQEFLKTSDKISISHLRYAISQSIAEEIYQLLTKSVRLKNTLTQEERPLLPSHICVLVRKNFQGTLIQEALRARQIPATIKSTGNVFKSEEAQELQYVLQAILEPHQSHFIRTAMVTTIFGKTAEDLIRLQTEESALEEMTVLLQEYHDIWKRSGVVSMARRMMSESKVHMQLLQRPQGKRRLTNFLHLIDLLHQASIKQRLSMEQTLSWLFKQRFEEEEEVEAYHLRPESPEEAIQIVTIHSAKGLEYPVVFCPFSWEEVKWSPSESLYYNQDSEQCLSFTPNASYQEQAKREILAEEFRLLYVALTRAEYRCYLVTRPAQDLGEDSVLFYILGKNPESFETNLSIQVSLPPPPAIRSLLPSKNPEAQEMKFRPFKTKIASDWKVASFSSMTKRKLVLEEESFPDHFPVLEELEREEETVSDVADKPQGIFAFRKGNQAGTCLHEILAELDFTRIKTDPFLESFRPLVREKLRSLRSLKDSKNYVTNDENIVLEMLRQVLTTSLSLENPFTLSDISQSNCLVEMEFYFPQRWLSREILSILWSQIVPSCFSESERAKLSKRIEMLDFQPFHGFMRGFIDLVFYHRGRYYLLDWKSNHLGNQVEDYHYSRLQTSMEKNYYILQYYIYWVALHQYLKYRLSDYDPQKHLGGVYYLYIRGMRTSLGPEYGVFQDHPSLEILEKLLAHLLETTSMFSR